MKSLAVLFVQVRFETPFFFYYYCTCVEVFVPAHDVLDDQHLPRVAGEDGDGVRGIALLQQVATQSDAQLSLVLVGLAARLVVCSFQNLTDNRRFPEITGKNNLTVFSYSGRVKSPEWRRQLRRADMRQF